MSTTNPLGVGTGGTPSTTNPLGSNPLEEDGRVNPGEGGVFGFFVNAFRDVKDIASGLWKLGGSVVHDVTQGIGDLADLDPGEADYVLDDMFNAVFGLGQFEDMGSVVLNDYQARYGSEGLAGGDLGVLYRNPLSFISDALMVATAGGWAAEQGVALAGKAGMLGDVAKVGTAADVASNVATVGSTANQLSTLVKLAKAVQGTATRVYNPLTKRVEVVQQALNPARRFLYQDRFLNLTGRSTPWLEAKALKYAKLAEDGGADAVKYTARADRYRLMAEQAYRTGADRVMLPGYARLSAKKWIDRTVGFATGKTARTPEAVLASLERNFNGLPDTIDDEAIIRAQQGVDTDLTSDGIVAPAGKGTRRNEVFDDDTALDSYDTGADLGDKMRVTRLGNGRTRVEGWHTTFNDGLPDPAVKPEDMTHGGFHMGDRQTAEVRAGGGRSWAIVDDDGEVVDYYFDDTDLDAEMARLEEDPDWSTRMDEDGNEVPNHFRVEELETDGPEYPPNLYKVSAEGNFAYVDDQMNGEAWRAKADELRAQGYDGAIYRNQAEGGKSVVIFDPASIRMHRPQRVRWGNVEDPRLRLERVIAENSAQVEGPGLDIARLSNAKASNYQNLLEAAKKGGRSQAAGIVRAAKREEAADRLAIFKALQAIDQDIGTSARSHKLFDDLDALEDRWKAKHPGKPLPHANDYPSMQGAVDDAERELAGLASKEAAKKGGQNLDAVDLGDGVWKVTRNGKATYMAVDEQGLVVNVMEDSAAGLGTDLGQTIRGVQGAQRSPEGTLSWGERVLQAYWKDNGIATPDDIIAWAEKQQLSKDGAALVKRAAKRVFPKAEPRLPGRGTDTRAAYDAAIETAREDARTLAPALRDEIGSEGKVIWADPKGEAQTKLKAELQDGTWRDVDDISRGTIIAEDAWTGKKLRWLEEKVVKVTGGRIVKRENFINNPLPDGSRGYRIVVMTPDGHPIEFQFLTPAALKVNDATRNLRNIVSTLTLLAKRGAMAAPENAERLQKAIRISQQLWEGVTDDLRALKGGPAAAELRRRINDFRLDVFRELTDPLLGRGLDIRSVFDNAYKPLRYQHMVRELGEDAAKGKVASKGDVVGGPSPLELDDALAQGGEMAPMYYPMMDAAQLPARGDWLRRGASISHNVSDQNLQRNTGKVLSEATYSKDMRTVWRVRAAQSARMQEHMDVLFDVVTEYGRPLKQGDEIIPGEELFAPALVKRLQEQHNMLLDELANDPTGKGLRDLLEEMNIKNIADAQRLIESGDMEVFAIPKFVAQRLRQHGTAKPFGEGVDILFGTPTRMWKALTLSFRPAWMVNNLFSNIIFLKLQGGKLTDVLRQLDKRYLAKMRDAIGDDALARIEGGLYSSSKELPRRFDTESSLGKVADFMQRRAAQGKVGRGATKYTDVVQSLNSSMEDAFRRAAYLRGADKAAERAGIHTAAKSFFSSKARIENAWRAGLDEPTWRAAVDEMNKYMNDYTSLSPLGRNVIRPYLVPFYAFYKHAAKLLLTMPFEHPAKSRLFALLQEADEERMKLSGLDPSTLPGYMKSDTLYIGENNAGDMRFMSGGGLNPFNAVLDSPLNTFHPAWKVLYEQGTGRSTFTNKAFTDPNTVKPFGSDQQYRINPDTGEVTPVETVTPGLMEHLLQQIPQYEMFKDALAGGVTYDTTTLADVLRGAEPVIDPATGLPVSPRSALGQLARLFGYSESTPDVAAMQARILADKTAAMQAWLRRYGGSGTESGGTAATTTNPLG